MISLCVSFTVKPQPCAHREGSRLLCPHQVFPAGISHLIVKPLPECPTPSQSQAVPASPSGMMRPRDGGTAGNGFFSLQPPPSQILGLPSLFAVAKGRQRRWEVRERCKALSTLRVYLSTRIFWSLQNQAGNCSMTKFLFFLLPVRLKIK